MSHFIWTEDGFINLDYVVKIDRERTGNSALWQFRFIDSRGEVLATTERAENAYYELLGTQQLIPAQPGFIAFRSREGTKELHETPVVAWRDSGGGPLDPIGADGCRRYHAVEWPDGQVYDGGTFFANRADYVLYLHEEAGRLVGVDPSVAH